jgi:hypothetical protein
MYIQQVYTQFLVQQHFTDLDSVGRHCAAGLHKFGARPALRPQRQSDVCAPRVHKSGLETPPGPPESFVPERVPRGLSPICVCSGVTIAIIFAFYSLNVKLLNYPKERSRAPIG